MKNANVWVICGGLALSLIAGLAAPLDESRQRAQTRRSDGSVASIDSCAPFIARGVRYAEVELRLDPEEREASFGF